MIIEARFNLHNLFVYARIYILIMIEKSLVLLVIQTRIIQTSGAREYVEKKCTFVQNIEEY